MDLALNELQRLIRHKNQPANQPTNQPEQYKLPHKTTFDFSLDQKY